MMKVAHKAMRRCSTVEIERYEGMKNEAGKAVSKAMRE